MERSDVVVIGSGIAGLYFALQLANQTKITLLTKQTLSKSNSNYAQGGIAAVLDKLDSVETHIKDTIIAGAEINNKRAVAILIKEGPAQIQHLLTLGVPFNKTNGQLDLTREGGHSNRRIVHVNDSTGRAVEHQLMHHVRRQPNIQIKEHQLALDLIVYQRRVKGVTVLDEHHQTVVTYQAPVVVLATGGCGQVYNYTTNPSIATGDGMAMAKRAGVKLQGMEFIQFHPTVLNLPSKPHLLLSESLRGEGAYLRNIHQKRFMISYDQRLELAPRDIVSRAVYQELTKGPVYLDFTHQSSKFIKQRFPYIYKHLLTYGLRLDQDLIPIIPAAHYACGGVVTDLFGRTTISGLYAIGEVAHTGVHGANRLASNSLLECLVFGARAAKHIQQSIKPYSKTILAKQISIQLSNATVQRASMLRKKIRNLMWQYAGIVRSQAGLNTGLQQLTTIQQQLTLLQQQGNNYYLYETMNICLVGMAILQAALTRKQNIGAHYETND